MLVIQKYCGQYLARIICKWSFKAQKQESVFFFPRWHERQNEVTVFVIKLSITWR